jgi:hypothetical protein
VEQLLMGEVAPCWGFVICMVEGKNWRGSQKESVAEEGMKGKLYVNVTFDVFRGGGGTSSL